MNPQPRLLTPHVTSAAIAVHEAAGSAYRIWSNLHRQFDAETLSSDATGPFPLYPLHAIKDRQDSYHVIAGFNAYQMVLPSLSATKKSRVTILCYPDLEDPAIERLSVNWLVNFIENGCLDRRVGLEQLRSLLDSCIDKRVLEQVCGTSRMSRSEFAPRAGISVSGLKAQTNKLAPKKNNRVTAKNYVLERLE